MWQDFYKKEVAGKTKAVHIDFLNTLLEIIEDEEWVATHPKSDWYLSCSLIDKLIEIILKFSSEQNLIVKKEFIVMAFFHYKLGGRAESE